MTRFIFITCSTCITCISFLALVAGCGGESDTDKKASGGSGGTSSGGTSSGGSGGSTTGGSGGATTGGSGGATTGGSGGATTGGSGGSSTGGSGGISGSGGSGATGTVSCGSFTSPTEECAAQEYCCGGQCQSNDKPCVGYAFHCDDASDCPGAFCCVTKLAMLDGGKQVSQCQAACDPGTQLIVCKEPLTQGGCPSGMTCHITATLPPEYGYCCPTGQTCSAT